MKNANETIQALKVLLGMEKAPEVVDVIETKFETVKLADGSEVSVDKLEIGGQVTLGDVLPTEGELILEDGTKLVIDATGLITEIKAPEVDEVAPVDAVDAAEVAPVTNVEDRVTALEEQVLNLIELIDMLTAMSGQFKSEQEVFSAQLKEIGNQEIVEPVMFKKVVKAFDEMSPLEQFMETRKNK